MKFTLDLPPGLAGDETSFAAAGRWADGSNVRFWRGRPQVIGGWERLTEEPLAGVCRGLLPWTDHSGALNLAFGTHAGLQVWRDGVLADVTPPGLGAGAVDGAGGQGYGTGAFSAGGYSEPSTAEFFPRSWALAAWGANLLASPRGGAIYRWANDLAAPAAKVAGAPEQVSHMIVAPQDQIFALGCEEEASGVFNPLCIRHSGVRAPESWTTAPDSTAREYVLPGGGRIVAGRVMGAQLLIWTSHALFVGTFVGSLAQPWRFDRVGENCGLIGPQAAVVVGQQAFWMGPDLQVRQYVLGGAPVLADGPFQGELAENLAPGQQDKIVASSLSAFAEVRFDYPDARDGVENSRYLRLSLTDGAWSRGRMARSAMSDAGPASHPIGVDPDGSVFWHERGQSADGGVIAWFIESADQYLDEGRTLMVRGLWPDFEDQTGAAALTLVSRLKPQGPARTFGPYPLAPGAPRLDLRASGRLFRIRLSGASAPSALRLGRLVFDAAPAGGR
ncbi:hypothetical protein [Phenylobacterium sp.]|uniref:hypothetical protein n=1 Tax=Phenylobacterium sp. TaxID=1871053 RepID=UPI0019916093|nr:hypothetical protein [Phenylobacterium sp.]MBC7168425.1 hypothetical protein [Phenylobacterium sp.]